MQFKDYDYKRVDLEQMKAEIEGLLDAISTSETTEALDDSVRALYQIRNDYETLSTIASVRFSINMNDEFYADEKAFYDEANPVMEGMITRFYKVLSESKHLDAIKENYGEHLMNLAEVAMKTYDDSVLEDLKEENKLITEYSRLVGNAKIQFRGGTYNISTMSPFVSSEDRETRKEAQQAVSAYFEANEVTLDTLYDRLVKLRHTIAKKLGYENFVQLGYDRLNRTDYGPEDVAVFRNQVLEHVVPLHTELRERQAKRLGLDHLYYYDLPLKFTTGNPKPAGEEAWMVEKAKQMYKELSPETNVFFTHMTDSGLMDLASKDGKRPGGYCTFMPNYESPFIFANFNGTDHDVTVLTHEAGHAFQMYESRHYEVSEYQFPTLEACEIHSMSMEYLTYPWMKSFFEEDTDKFIFTHSSEPIEFLPYGVTVDEFQHWVYENPEATPRERKLKWRELEKKYLPHKDYTGDPFLDRGGFWFRQGHIFRVPFYYIDYTLALTCACQFYVKSTKDRDKAWSDYLRLCQAGGSMPFTALLEVADVQNPFKEGALKEVVGVVKDVLDGIDDTLL